MHRTDIGSRESGIGSRGSGHARRPADVIIVGAGATGGWAAKRLAEAGLQVVVLDAGRPFGPEDFREHIPAHALPLRARTKAVIARTQPQQAAGYPLHRMERRLVRQRHRRALHDAAGPAVSLGRPHAHRRRPHARVGASELPLQRHRLQVRVTRRLRDRLAAVVRGSRRPTTTSSNATSASPASTKASRSCPTSSCSRPWGSRASRPTCARRSGHRWGVRSRRAARPT